MLHKFFLTLALCVATTTAFAPISSRQPSTLLLQAEKEGFLAGVSNFFAELDAFIDDASARRLGNGAAFYGKRKSNFYGEDDKMKKLNSKVADPTEDYQGPTTAGYFKWMPDENGQMRPVTRMKEMNIERNPSFWDRAFTKEGAEE